MRLRPAVLALALLISPAACKSRAPEVGQAPVPVGKSERSITVDSRQRTFHLYRPASLPAKTPLVVMLHGGFGSGTQAESAYGWDELADKEHFLVVYPDGVDRAWNTGGGCCGSPGRNDVDDVAFLRAMIEAIGRQIPVDPERTYATGMSNGAIMSYRLACDTDLFAAIAPVAGTLLGACPAPHPTSVLHIHGLADHNVRFDGAVGEGVAAIDGPPVPDVISAWRQVDQCSPPVTSTQDPVATSAAACPGGRSVTLITVAGAGHQWPGSGSRNAVQKVLGMDEPSSALDATSVIWTFFTAHPLTP